MTNEAVILELNEFSNPKQYTCAAAVSISKGALLKLSGDNTVIASGANDSAPYAGVAAMDKDGRDSSTKISVYTPGQGNRFDMMVNANTTVTNGALVAMSGANAIRNAVEADIPLGNIIGRAEEAGTASEVIVVLS